MRAHGDTRGPHRLLSLQTLRMATTIRAKWWRQIVSRWPNASQFLHTTIPTIAGDVGLSWLRCSLKDRYVKWPLFLEGAGCWGDTSCYLWEINCPALGEEKKKTTDISVWNAEDALGWNDMGQGTIQSERSYVFCYNLRNTVRNNAILQGPSYEIIENCLCLQL